LAETFTKTTTTSYKKGVKGSAVGILIGLIFFIASFFILWINEGGSLRNEELSKYMEKNVISVQPNIINQQNNSKLIHISGFAKTEESIGDELIKMPKAISLIRKVEMYQWKENKQSETKNHSNGSSTTETNYTYEKVWSANLIDSSNFEYRTEHQNSPSFPIKSTRINAYKVMLGEFSLNSGIINKINATRKITQLPTNSKYRIMNGFYFSGKDYDTPQIGDLKISYTYIPSGTAVSVIGQQYNNSITSYSTKNDTIELVSSGTKSSTDMITEFKTNKFWEAMLMRLTGFICMFVGLLLITAPITALSRILPIFSNIVEFFTTAAMLIISLSLTLITISLAWLAYRPLISISVIAGAVSLVMLIKKKKKNQDLIRID